MILRIEGSVDKTHFVMDPSRTQAPLNAVEIIITGTLAFTGSVHISGDDFNITWPVVAPHDALRGIGNENFPDFADVVAVLQHQVPGIHTLLHGIEDRTGSLVSDSLIRRNPLLESGLLRPCRQRWWPQNGPKQHHGDSRDNDDRRCGDYAK
jgi:hypothetical protein